MMQTSKEWWETTKASPEAINDWLQKQYTGEATAASRIMELSEEFNTDRRVTRILMTIANQEMQHSEWIRDLLISRGINPTIGNPNGRYWKETLKVIKDFETGAAIAAHAEKMRLERITVISEDEEAPEDIREVFKKILVDELFHERAFRSLSTDEAMRNTLETHQAGMEALGLVI